ncbi:hypothetical protein GCM10018781_40350 [Kitasatospora indigofera]|uniref:Uncharacterized protein n=1 Tax=Kitasatospora indigofera TaxID=67307 RepID=A0A919FXA1_9ACTN|nr:hypothetical protein [Kitasatospora indigofera]GHH74207.1 hypothetical protein GCM10018781_40350 [Kitasatospora indigofera]
MPTILVESTVDDPLVHRRFAKNISRWLRGQGVDINHVITKFVSADPERYFSGPFPLARPGSVLSGEAPAGAEGPAAGRAGAAGGFAFVQCTVDLARPAGFRTGLAERIVEELRGSVDAGRTFIQFHEVRPELHLVGSELLAAVSGE